MTRRGWLARLATLPRPPWHTIRLRLAAIYGGLFLICGTGLVAITYVLVRNSIVSYRFSFAPPRGSLGPSSELTVTQARALVASERASELHHLIIYSGFALAAMAVLSVALGWVAAGRALRPLRTITAAVRDISATSLDRRLSLDGPSDELKELGDTFDDLLGRLEASFASQRQFAANASHELRTPLAWQRTLVQVALADPDADAESLRAAHERVLASGAQQERIIEALLTLTRGQAGLDRREPFDLATLAGRVLHARQSQARDLQLAIQADLAPAPAAGDPRLAERLIANLADNALRHNAPGGHVEVVTAIRDFFFFFFSFVFLFSLFFFFFSLFLCFSVWLIFLCLWRAVLVAVLHCCCYGCSRFQALGGPLFPGCDGRQVAFRFAAQGRSRVPHAVSARRWVCRSRGFRGRGVCRCLPAGTCCKPRSRVHRALGLGSGDHLACTMRGGRRHVAGLAEMGLAAGRRRRRPPSAAGGRRTWSGGTSRRRRSPVVRRTQIAWGTLYLDTCCAVAPGARVRPGRHHDARWPAAPPAVAVRGGAPGCSTPSGASTPRACSGARALRRQSMGRPGSRCPRWAWHSTVSSLAVGSRDQAAAWAGVAAWSGLRPPPPALSLGRSPGGLRAVAGGKGAA